MTARWGLSNPEFGYGRHAPCEPIKACRGYCGGRVGCLKRADRNPVAHAALGALEGLATGIRVAIFDASVALLAIC